MISAGRLIAVLEKWVPPSAAFFLCYPTAKPAPLQALIDFLRANLKTNAKSEKQREPRSAMTMLAFAKIGPQPGS
jgi:hypothetical protein